MRARLCNCDVQAAVLKQHRCVLPLFELTRCVFGMLGVHGCANAMLDVRSCVFIIYELTRCVLAMLGVHGCANAMLDASSCAIATGQYIRDI